MTRYRILIGISAALASIAALGTSPPAAAEPATTVSYGASASATWFKGDAFDACDAPSTSTMNAWKASPFRGIGVYIGGPNRTCHQENLTSTWVRTVSTMGWRLIPIYMGHQAPCSTRRVRFTATNASTIGTQDAADAVAKAAALGMLPGSAIYGDVENYTASDSSCRTAVLRYVSSFTKELHRRGYLSGIYANLASGAAHLSAAYSSTSYARPDALWVARWDGVRGLSFSGIPSSQWANHQRGKQYRGDHDERWGGVTINIDSDYFDAPVATVAYSYRSTTSLNARSAPSTSAPVVTTYASGATLRVVCQTPGTTVGSTSVWDKLSNGSYLTDAYVSTPSSTTYSRPLPRCTYPFQVTTSTLNLRAGPSSSATVSGTLPSGALGWVYCQRSGSTVGTTSVWDRLVDGEYATDYYLATPSKTTYSKPIPRC